MKYSFQVSMLRNTNFNQVENFIVLLHQSLVYRVFPPDFAVLRLPVYHLFPAIFLLNNM